MVEATNYEDCGGEDGFDDDGFDEDAWDEYGAEAMMMDMHLEKKGSIQEGKVYIKNKEHLPYTIFDGASIIKL